MLTANLKVGKQVGFGDAIRAPDFYCRNFAFVQQLVPRFGADSQGIAHLLDVGEKSAIVPPKKIPSPLLPFALVQATQNHNLFLLQKGYEATRLLCDMIRGKRKAQRLVLPHTLTVRDSVRPL